jgi:hypothetical protein
MAAAATAAAAPSLIAGHGQQRLVTERKTTHNGLKEWSLETARKKKTSPRRMLQQCRAQHGFFSSSSSRGGGKHSSSSRSPAMREEDAATLQEMTKLSDELFLLKGVLKQEGGDRGIGLDMRNRVDILYNRATMLKQSADRSVAAGGGRISVQLTATLRVRYTHTYGCMDCLIALPVSKKERKFQKAIVATSVVLHLEKNKQRVCFLLLQLLLQNNDSSRLLIMCFYVLFIIIPIRHYKESLVLWRILSALPWKLDLLPHSVHPS